MDVVSKSGANANDFRIEPSSTCSVSAGVAPGASCRVDLSFNPTVIGSESASLVLAHNAAGGSSSVPLSGIGTVAATPTIEDLMAGRDTVLERALAYLDKKPK